MSEKVALALKYSNRSDVFIAIQNFSNSINYCIMNTYQQIENSIRAMNRVRGIESVTLHNGSNHWNYLVNITYKRAVMLHSVAYPTRPHGSGGRNLGVRFAADYANRVCTVSVGKRGIQEFFRFYPGFRLVVSVGSEVHDTCLLIKRNPHIYDFVWYNPNPGETVNRCAKDLMRKLSPPSFRLSRSFNDPDGNRHARCSELVWELISKFVAGHGVMPPSDELLSYDARLQKYV